MADRIARADGNFTDAATWGAVDATSLLHAENGNTALTTSYVESQSFTPGAIEIDAIAVKVATRAATPSGTISIRLASGGVTVAGTEVTINVDDIPHTTLLYNGWLLFKLAAPVTLPGGALTLSAKTSAATQVNLYRNATAANWSRLLRRTTTGAPAAGDNLWILGEWTAAATKTDRTVTMNQTAATDYGTPAFTGAASLGIGNGGSLVWGTTAATNYILRLSGDLHVWAGGILTMGADAGGECPRDSSMELQFDCAADGDFGITVYDGTWNMHGLSRTTGLDVPWCLLETDEAAGQTALGVDRETGWLSGDEIAIAATTITASQAERRTLNGNATADTVTVTVGLTNAHGGGVAEARVVAEVILLTRNVRVVSVSSTNMSYVNVKAGATILWSWAAFRYMGAVTTGKRGLEIEVSTGSMACEYCCAYDFDNHGLNFASAAHGNWTVEHFVGYELGNSGGPALNVATTTGASMTLNDVVLITNGGFTAAVEIRDLAVTITSLRVNSHSGVLVSVPSNGEAGIITGTWSDWNIHSGSNGLQINIPISGTISNFTAWRAATGGLGTGGVAFGTVCTDLLFDTGSITGCPPAGIGFSSTAALNAVTFRDFVLAPDSGQTQPHGVKWDSVAGGRMRFENCTFGVATEHTTADFLFHATSQSWREIVLVNCLLASTNRFVNTSSLQGRSFIAEQSEDQVAGTDLITYPALGTVTRDTVLFRTATPSEKLEPTAAPTTLRLRSTPKRFGVASGASLSVSAYVQKDGSYVGSAPRLVVKENPSAGVAEAVVDTMTVGSGVWEQLTGTVGPVSEDTILEFCVEVDGAAGQVNVDDWSRA